MADTRKGRDKKARDEEKRQRKRELEEERKRKDEPEPEDSRAELDEDELEPDENVDERLGESPEGENPEMEGDEVGRPPTEIPEEAPDDEELTVDQRDRDDRNQQVDGRGRDSPLGDVDELLDDRDYPVSAEEFVADHGRQEIESNHGKTTLEEVLAPEDDETFDSPEELREQIEDRLERE